MQRNNQKHIKENNAIRDQQRKEESQTNNYYNNKEKSYINRGNIYGNKEYCDKGDIYGLKSEYKKSEYQTGISAAPAAGIQTPKESEKIDENGQGFVQEESGEESKLELPTWTEIIKAKQKEENKKENNENGATVQSSQYEYNNKQQNNEPTYDKNRVLLGKDKIIKYLNNPSNYNETKTHDNDFYHNCFVIDGKNKKIENLYDLLKNEKQK